MQPDTEYAISRNTKKALRSIIDFHLENDSEADMQEYFELSQEEVVVVVKELTSLRDSLEKEEQA